MDSGDIESDSGSCVVGVVILRVIVAVVWSVDTDKVCNK